MVGSPVDPLCLWELLVHLDCTDSAAGLGSAAGPPKDFTVDHLVDLAVATLPDSAVGTSVDLAARILVSTPANDRDEGAVIAAPVHER